MWKFLVLFLFVTTLSALKETGPVDKNINFLQLHRDNHEMVVKRKDKHVVMLYHTTESWCSKNTIFIIYITKIICVSVCSPLYSRNPLTSVRRRLRTAAEGGDRASGFLKLYGRKV